MHFKLHKPLKTQFKESVLRNIVANTDNLVNPKRQPKQTARVCDSFIGYKKNNLLNLKKRHMHLGSLNRNPKTWVMDAVA